mmetsp:Transcript_26326/g.47211  ORF Transcript_26326/g.47211 Transcript_26326/m.47211 type:complete len:265 (+) Transcript_26326:1965-2759(+)
MRALLRRFQSTVDFGSKTVKIEEKQKLVNEVFTSVASSYDIMNDLMSLGVHRLWKQEFVDDIGKFPLDSPIKTLDVAGGTGDIAFQIWQKYINQRPAFISSPPQLHITVSDINADMLEVGKTRAPAGANLSWMEANAEELPFEDNLFDLYTISFGIRNVPDKDKALREAFRVLKPGGRFMCLEFSKVTNPVLAQMYSLHSQYYIPNVGQLVANDRASYVYLVESIERFPSQEEFAFMISKAGFSSVHHRDLTWGIAAIHSGVKL